MPSRKIGFAPGRYYHIYNRGAGRQSIFREDENYLFVLRVFRRVAQECNVAVVAYCLLPNHYHWLGRPDGDTPAGKLPARGFGSYSQALNRRDKRTGTLFEGAYKAIEVTSDEYLRHLCRYIHANPVLHGIADAPALWPYSNYLDWIGQRPGTLYDPAFVTEQFGTPARYRSFVEDYLVGKAMLPAGLGTYLAELER
jgi:REP element-mobilizing transposase RayT